MQVRPGTVQAVPDRVDNLMARCPRCTCSRVGHTWRVDMARLVLIDEWKCLDAACGQHWDDVVTYAQLQEAAAVRTRTGEAAPAHGHPSGSQPRAGRVAARNR